MKLIPALERQKRTRVYNDNNDICDYIVFGRSTFLPEQ